MAIWLPVALLVLGPVSGCRKDALKKTDGKVAKALNAAKKAPRTPAKRTAKSTAKPAPPVSTTLVPTSIHGHAQFFQLPAAELLETQECQLTTGRVTAYSASGSLFAEGDLSPSGSFVLLDLVGKPSDPERAAGLQPGEIRVFIDLPTGSTLTADSKESFVHVTPITTILSRARQNRPGLTLEQAETALRSYLDLPANQSLEDLGGETSPFSEAAFWEAARSWNEQNKAPLSDIDSFVDHVEDGVQDHADGRVTATKTFRTPLGAGPLLGLGTGNVEPVGSLDPDQFTGAAGEAGTFDPSLYEKAGNLGFANTIVNSVCSGLSGLGTFVLVFDAAANEQGVSKLSKWVGGFGIGAVITQMVSSLVLDILANNEPDPVQEGLRFISGQIDALSQQLAQTEAKILFNLEQQRTQDKYEQLLSRLNALLTLRPPSPAPQHAAPFQLASQNFAATPLGTSSATTLASSMLGINNSQNGIRLFHQMLDTRLGMTPATNQDRMGFPIRSNELIMQARNLPMRYVNMLTSAMQVTSEESRVFMNLYGSPAHRLNALQDTMEAATPAFGTNGLAALRRRGLQQAPPRFISPEIFVDSTRGEAGRGLVWSREVMVRAFDDTLVRRDTIGSRTFRTYIDGNQLKPGNYRLNDELPEGIGWRLPTLDELRSLPGWGKGDAGLLELKNKTGIDSGGRHLFAVLDRSAPDPIEVENVGFGTLSYAYTSGQVRFYSFHSGTGNQWTGLEATRNRNPPDTVNCLRVLDLHTFPGSLPNVPTVTVNGRLANGLYAWPDSAARKPTWWPAKAYYSSIMRSTGIPPTNIAVIDQIIPNPWYSQTPNETREVPSHLKVLSALAFWELKSSGNETRGFVEDVSGLVEWQSSNASVAVAGNMFNRFDSVEETAGNDGRFVSPWFAPITFSRADAPVTFTAHWVQGLLSETPSNRITITQAADPHLCVPPVPSALDVSPGNLLYTSLNQIDGISMAATRYWTDRSAEDATNGVQWSLLEVTKDAAGQEITTPLTPELATISQGSGGATGGILKVYPGAGTPARTMRVIATDSVSGRTSKADLRLQF